MSSRWGTHGTNMLRYMNLFKFLGFRKAGHHEKGDKVKHKWRPNTSGHYCGEIMRNPHIVN
jgi:hypothetical protein